MTPLRRAIALLTCLPAALTAVRLAGWWPCDVACEGGGMYERIAGISVLWPALVAYVAFAALAVHDAWRQPRWSPTTCGLAGLLAGAALFYLWVAWSLEMVCPFCLTVHGLALAALLAVAPDAAGTAAVCLLLSGLGLNTIFHHRVAADVAPSATSNQPTGTVSELALRADANRVRGRSDAPVTIEYAYTLQCAHCAEQHGPLLDALGPAIADGRVRLVMRAVVRPADVGSMWLARWSFAAASEGPEALDRFLLEHLATKSSLSREELLTLGGDLPRYDQLAAHGDFDAQVDDDQQALRRLGYKGATPFVAIVRERRVEARFVRDIPLQRVVELATAATPTP